MYECTEQPLVEVITDQALEEYKKSKQRNRYWWNEEIEEMINTNGGNYNRYLSLKIDQNKKEYSTTQRRVQNTITPKKNKILERDVDKTSSSSNRNTSDERMNSWINFQSHFSIRESIRANIGRNFQEFKALRKTKTEEMKI